uniref:Uncharacterized protein n=1 Tax=Fagus sylvatica TaxID=28930 RepID=A0A2N9H8X3_FAGSY
MRFTSRLPSKISHFSYEEFQTKPPLRFKVSHGRKQHKVGSYIQLILQTAVIVMAFVEPMEYNIKKGSGCAIWLGDLLDIRQFPADGQDLYIRMHATVFGTGNGHKKNIAAIVACSIVVVSGMLLGSYYVCSKENLRGIMERIRTIVHSSNSKGPEEDMELPLFDLSTIARATDDFSLNNKLGEGGCGPVYKVNWQYVGTVNSKEIVVIDLQK